ncbi:MAG: flagellar filament capping protein FliD [Nitrospinae bacterium]|nr:flagellar filament capping protein FliD [Nitrospinota bacterium]
MAITVDGLISGMNTTSIISQIMEIERRPIQLIEDKRTVLSNEKAAWQEASTRMLALESAAAKLSSTSKFASRSATFANNNSAAGTVMSVSSESTAVDGSYNIKVSQLAQAQKSASNQTFSSFTAAAGLSGTITIGSTNVSVTSGQSLEEIKNNITNSGAGVSATIINAGTSASQQYMLMVTGDDTGAANAFSMSTSMNLGTLSFSTTQAAQNANLTVDGVAITKSSNTVDDVIADTTLNLQTLGSGTVTVSTDYDIILENVQAFVSAYNDAMDYFREQLSYDSTNQTKGTLFGNGTLMTMQNQLRAIMSGSIPGIDPTDPTKLSSLSQVGIKTDINNQLTVDTTTFSDTLKSRFTEVARLFAPSGSGTYTFISATGLTQGGVYDTKVEGGVLKLKKQGTSDWISLTQDGNYAYGATDSVLDGLLLRTGSLTEGATGTMTITNGVASRVEANTGSYTEFSTEGLIFNQNRSIESRDAEFQDQVSDLEVRLTKKEEDLKAKFANLEVLLAKLTSQQQYLSQQLSSLNTNWGR